MKRLVVLAAASMLVSCGDGSSSSSSARSEPSEAHQIATYQVAAKDKLKDALRDPASAKYENVKAHRVAGGYVFCGRLNAKNGFGGYSGFERFVASPGIAATESMVTDFEQVWSQVCSPSSEVQSVWF